MRNNALTDDAHALAERLKQTIYEFDRPVERLVRDIAPTTLLDIVNHTTPHQRLVEASPPLLPPAAALVAATARIWGRDLFHTESGRLLVRVLAIAGPVAAADKLLFQADTRSTCLPRLLTETAKAYRAVFGRYPESWLTETSGGRISH
ncbi:hypothetical protein [Paraburkholderia rhizosphaerae]|uniref:Uncharacterized protein n=1 Tax=Paraburkholderia rhizosphaerae TaxID=480658 RepID=A0A4R8LPM3_9BURK|nr:hypothetical protein [Paraburkholderia rhizosphaerae]TDY48252.1 hypothetical protein BX592_111187 [Paraburkholderia rhizosphaerae]